MRLQVQGCAQAGRSAAAAGSGQRDCNAGERRVSTLTLPLPPAPPARCGCGAYCGAAWRTTAAHPCSSAWPPPPRPLQQQEQRKGQRGRGCVGGWRQAAADSGSSSSCARRPWPSTADHCQAPIVSRKLLMAMRCCGERLGFCVCRGVLAGQCGGLEVTVGFESSTSGFPGFNWGPQGRVWPH